VRELNKEITLNGSVYQINRMTASNGSWILAQVITKMLPVAMETGFSSSGMQLPSNRSQLNEQEFQNIQHHCLRVCSRYEPQGDTRVAQPILFADGRFAFKDLEYDLVTVTALTVHALVFNLSPFFDAGALKPIMESFRGLLPEGFLTAVNNAQS